MSASRPPSYRLTLSHDTPSNSPRSPSLTSLPHASIRPSSFHGRRGPSPLSTPRPNSTTVRAGNCLSPPLAMRGSPPPPCKRPGKIRPHAAPPPTSLANGVALQAKTRYLIPRIGLTGTAVTRWTNSSTAIRPHLDSARGINDLPSVTLTGASNSHDVATSHVIQAGKSKPLCTEGPSSLGRGVPSSAPRTTLGPSSSPPPVVCSNSSRTSQSRASPSSSTPHCEPHSSSGSAHPPSTSDIPAHLPLTSDGHALSTITAEGRGQSSEEAQTPLLPIVSSAKIPLMRPAAPSATPVIAVSSPQTNSKAAPCSPVSTQTATTPNPVQSVNKFMRRLSRGKRKHTVVNKYCEEMNQLNEVANNRPRGALIHSIQQENRYIRELQEENKELRLALEEQQNVMELIMSKYREQVAKLLSSGPDPHSADNTAMQRKLGANIERVSEMVCVMRRAAQLDEDQSHHFQQLVTALVRENKGLREMLHIAIHSGSVASPERLDADTQTDPSTASDTDTIKLNPNFSGSASSAAAAGDGGEGASSISQTAGPSQHAPTAAAVEPLISPDRGDASNITVIGSESEQSSSDEGLLNNNQSRQDDEGRGGPPDESATS